MIVTCRILYGITGTSNNTAIKTVVTTVGSRFGVLSACLHNAPNEIGKENVIKAKWTWITKCISTVSQT